MSESRFGKKLFALILLVFTAVNYFIAFYIKFFTIHFNITSESYSIIGEMVDFERFWGIHTVELIILLTSLILIAVVVVRNIDLQLKYNIIYAGTIVALLLMIFAFLPYRILYFNYILIGDGFNMPSFIVVFLALVTTGCFLIIAILAKLNLRNL